MRRFASLVAALAFVAVPVQAQAAPDPALVAKLGRYMQAAGSQSGAYVVNLTDSETVFGWRQNKSRILASNTKLFTTATALARFGTEGTLGTEVRGSGSLEETGVWRGDLYLHGGGDPTFGSRTFTRRAYGAGATVEDLALALDTAGIQRVTGRIRGDESVFDPLRGGPDSGYSTSVWVGPLSGLAYNHGLGDERGRSFQVNPPVFAAARLDGALESRGIAVRAVPRSGVAPPEAAVLASVDSPAMADIVRMTNKPSDNYFAEMLLKDVGRQAAGQGTTAGGARVAADFARDLGARARLVDGSGLSRSNRASPRGIVRFLTGMQGRDEFDAWYASLPIAGRDGTLSTRMRSGAARGRCHAKTGTLSNVSALSGYCEALSGDLYAFSILMNGVYPPGARQLQDRMAQALAAEPD
ncbi:MAG TPA: D-alanyl-D-alanine carboxypeptidase/D-alanyl-D-alanine-endopeptidase [Thermoleophilaceae bacterium]